MDKLKLLIIDGNEDDRVILKAICEKVDGFEIQESTDNEKTIHIVESWQPHIILVDMTSSKIDDMKVFKIIKQDHPSVVIAQLTTVNDLNLQEHIDIYIHKPLNPELLQYKLQSISASLRLKLGNFKNLSKKISFNPFRSDIRSFKTIFDIADLEAIMDFGVWFFDQYNNRYSGIQNSLDKVLELFYLFMMQGYNNNESISLIVEESYEEFYITMKFDTPIVLDEELIKKFADFGSELIAEENIVCVKLAKFFGTEIFTENGIDKVVQEKVAEQKLKIKENENKEEEISIVKEVKVINSNEKELLKQSFINKTSAADYVDEIGGDVLDEIRDLASIDEEWMLKLREIEEYPTSDTLKRFVDLVLNVYVKAINNLFEFTALGYALSSLGTFIKDSADTVSQDASKIKMLVMLLEHLGTDLSSWREHIFIMQDTADIHYLDSSFFSSCMQIEGIISDKDIGAHDDDNDMEFF